MADLLHWGSERYQACMREAGVADEDDLDRVIANLQRLGFAERQPDNSICFRTRVYRFLDLCQDIQKQCGRDDEGEAD